MTVKQDKAFDLEKGRLALSPRLAWMLIAAALSVGSAIAAVHYRLGSIESGIAEVQVIAIEDRQAAQTKAAAYVQCLEAERANKNWKCPMAPPLEAEKPAMRHHHRKNAAKDTPSSYTFPWELPVAKAATKR